MALVAAACSGSSTSDAAASSTAAEPVSTTDADAASPTEVPTTAAPTTTTEVPCEAPPSGEATTDFAGRERTYVVQNPVEGIVEGTPLVLLLHGFTSNPERILEVSTFDELGTEVLVVAPLATGQPSSWEIGPPPQPPEERNPAYDGPDDLGFLLDLTAKLQADYPCLGELWAAGLSAGSAMAAVFMCAEPEGLAGVGLVAAMIPAVCAASSVRPMWVFHGTADIAVSYEGGPQTVGDGTIDLPSIEDAVRDWAALGGCDTDEPAEAVTLAVDVIVRAYGTCPDGISVQLHTLVGGNHNWPGGPDDQLPPVNTSISATCVLLGQMLGRDGAPYDLCLT